MQNKKKQIQNYLAQNVNIFIQPMVYQIVKNRPTDPIKYAIKWLKNYTEKQKIHKNDNTDSENQDLNEIPFDENKLIKKKGKTRSRMGISQEVFGLLNKKNQVALKDVPKNQETRLLILSLIRNSILFQNLDYKEEEILIKAMEEKQIAQGQTIIQENQDGDALYIVDTGEYDCFKIIEGEEKYLKTYKHGQAFGQLALMYNAPRAATIKAKKGGKIYSLDRITFSQVVKTAASSKRQLYKKVIDSIELLSDATQFQKQRLYDVLKEEKFQEGQFIIKQGDSGNKFYIVIEGDLVAERRQTEHDFPKIVYQYKEGDYFGELALIHDMNRQASIKALTKARVASIGRDTFKRILGSLEDIMKRNEDRYKNYQESIICS